MFKILILAFILFHVVRAIRWKNVKPNFAGKTIFISGGSSGIGELLCKTLLEYGAKKIIIASRKVEELNRVKREC